MENLCLGYDYEYKYSRKKPVLCDLTIISGRARFGGNFSGNFGGNLGGSPGSNPGRGPVRGLWFRTGPILCYDVMDVNEQ